MACAAEFPLIMPCKILLSKILKKIGHKIMRQTVHFRKVWCPLKSFYFFYAIRYRDRPKSVQWTPALKSKNKKKNNQNVRLKYVFLKIKLPAKTRFRPALAGSRPLFWPLRRQSKKFVRLTFWVQLNETFAVKPWHSLNFCNSRPNRVIHMTGNIGLNP